MKDFTPVYIPVGVPTFHLESAQDQFDRSAALLKGIDEHFVCPDKMLLTLDEELISGCDFDRVDLIQVKVFDSFFHMDP